MHDARTEETLIIISLSKQTPQDKGGIDKRWVDVMDERVLNVNVVQ